jgi:hypothetical protein
VANTPDMKEKKEKKEAEGPREIRSANPELVIE